MSFFGKKKTVLILLLCALVLLAGCFQITPRTKLEKGFKVKTELVGTSHCQNTACMCMVEENRYRYVLWTCDETFTFDEAVKFPREVYNSSAGDSCTYIGDSSGSPQSSCLNYDIDWMGEARAGISGRFKAWDCDDCCYFGKGKTHGQVMTVACTADNPDCRIDYEDGRVTGDECGCSVTDGFRSCAGDFNCKTARCEFQDAEGRGVEDFCYRASPERPAVGSPDAAGPTVFSSGSSVYDFWGSCSGGSGSNRIDCEEDGGDWEEKDFADEDHRQVGTDPCSAKCTKGSPMAAWHCLKKSSGVYNLHMHCETKVLRTLQGGRMFKVVPCDAQAMKEIMENPLLELSTFKIGQGPNLESYDKAKAACLPSLEKYNKVTLGLPTFNPETLNMPGFASLCLNNKDNEKHFLKDRPSVIGFIQDIEVDIGECIKTIKLIPAEHAISDQKTGEELSVGVSEADVTFQVGKETVYPANAQADYTSQIIFEGEEGLEDQRKLRIEGPAGEDAEFYIGRNEEETFNGRRPTRDELLYPGPHTVYSVPGIWMGEGFGRRWVQGVEENTPLAELFIYSTDELTIGNGRFQCSEEFLENEYSDLACSDVVYAAIGASGRIKIKNEESREHTVYIYRKVGESLETVEEKKMLPNMECSWIPPEPGIYYFTLDKQMEIEPEVGRTVGRPSTETNCYDGVDDDGDGKADCLDHPDCDGKEWCQGLEHEFPTDRTRNVCSDRVDNDGDGEKDCKDVDCCVADETCRQTNDCKRKLGIPVETEGSGSIPTTDTPDAYVFVSGQESKYTVDIQDAAFSPSFLTMLDTESICFLNPSGNERTVKLVGYTLPGKEFVENLGNEICDDGMDNDLDGKADCNDEDCEDAFELEFGFGEGAGVERICEGVALTSELEGSVQHNCNDLIDNNLNGVVDCNDYACRDDPACSDCFGDDPDPSCQQGVGVEELIDDQTITIPPNYMTCDCLFGKDKCFTPKKTGVYKFRDLRNKENLVVGVTQGSTYYFNLSFIGITPTVVPVSSQGTSQICFVDFDSDLEERKISYQGYFDSNGQKQGNPEPEIVLQYGEQKCRDKAVYPPGLHVFKDVTDSSTEFYAYVFSREPGNDAVGNKFVFLTASDVIPTRLDMTTEDNLYIINTDGIPHRLSNSTALYAVDPFAKGEFGGRGGQLRGSPSGTLVLNSQSRINWTGWELGMKKIKDETINAGIMLSIIDPNLAAQIPRVGPAGGNEEARVNLATIWTAGPPSLLTLRKMRGLIANGTIPALVLSFSGEIPLSVTTMNRNERFQVLAGSKVELTNIDETKHAVIFNSFQKNPVSECQKELGVPDKPLCDPDDVDKMFLACKPKIDSCRSELDRGVAEYRACITQLATPDDVCMFAWGVCVYAPFFEQWMNCVNNVEPQYVGQYIGVPERGSSNKVFDLTSLSINRYGGERVTCNPGGTEDDCGQGQVPSPNWFKVSGPEGIDYNERLIECMQKPSWEQADCLNELNEEIATSENPNFRSTAFSGIKEGIYTLADYSLDCFNLNDEGNPNRDGPVNCQSPAQRNDITVDVIDLSHDVFFELVKMSKSEASGRQVCFENAGKVSKSFSVRQFFKLGMIGADHESEPVELEYAGQSESYTAYWDKSRYSVFSARMENDDRGTSNPFCSTERLKNRILEIFVGKDVDRLEPVIDIKDGEFSSFIDAPEDVKAGMEVPPDAQDVRFAGDTQIKINNKATGLHKITVNGVPFAVLSNSLRAAGIDDKEVYYKQQRSVFLGGDAVRRIRVPVLGTDYGTDYVKWNPETSEVSVSHVGGWSSVMPVDSEVYSPAGKYVIEDVRDDERCDSDMNELYRAELEAAGVCSGADCSRVETCATKIVATGQCNSFCPDRNNCETIIEGGYTADRIFELAYPSGSFCGADPDKAPANYEPGTESPDKQSMHSSLESRLGIDPNVDSEASRNRLAEICNELAGDLRDEMCRRPTCDPAVPLGQECEPIRESCGEQPIDPEQGDCDALQNGGAGLDPDRIADLPSLCEEYFQLQAPYAACMARYEVCEAARSIGGAFGSPESCQERFDEWNQCVNDWENNVKAYDGDAAEVVKKAPGSILVTPTRSDEWRPEWMDAQRRSDHVQEGCFEPGCVPPITIVYEGATKSMAYQYCTVVQKALWDSRAWGISQDWYNKHWAEKEKWNNCMDICRNCETDCADDYSDTKLKQRSSINDEDLSFAQTVSEGCAKGTNGDWSFPPFTSAMCSRCDYATGVCDAYMTFSTPNFANIETYPNYVYIKDATYSRGMQVEVYNGAFENSDAIGGTPKRFEGQPAIFQAGESINKNHRDETSPVTVLIEAAVSGGTGKDLKNPFTVRVVFKGDPANPASFYAGKVNFVTSYSMYEGAMGVKKEIYYGPNIDVNNPAFEGPEGKIMMLDDSHVTAGRKIKFVSEACHMSEENRERMGLVCNTEADLTPVIVQSNWDDAGLKNILPGERGCFTAVGQGRDFHIYDDNVGYPVTGEDADLWNYLRDKFDNAAAGGGSGISSTTDGNSNCNDIDDHAGFVFHGNEFSENTEGVVVANFSYSVLPFLRDDLYRGDPNRTTLFTSSGSRVCFVPTSVTPRGGTMLITPATVDCRGRGSDCDIDFDEGGYYTDKDDAKRYILTYGYADTDDYERGSVGRNKHSEWAWARSGYETKDWIYEIGDTDASDGSVEDMCWYPPANSQEVGSYEVKDPYSGQSFTIRSGEDLLSLPLILEQFEPSMNIYARSGSTICVKNDDPTGNAHTINIITFESVPTTSSRQLEQGAPVCFRVQDQGDKSCDYAVEDVQTGKRACVRVTDECSIYGEEAAVIAKRMMNYDHPVFNRPEFNEGPVYNEHGPATPAIITTEVGVGVSDECRLAQLRSIKENCYNCTATMAFLEPGFEDFRNAFDRLTRKYSGNGLFSYTHDDTKEQGRPLKGTPILDLAGVFAMFKKSVDETCNPKEILNEVKLKANYSLQWHNTNIPEFRDQTDIHGDPITGSYNPGYADKKDYKRPEFKSGELPQYIGDKAKSIPTIVLGYGFVNAPRFSLFLTNEDKQVQICKGAECLEFPVCELTEPQMADAFKDFFTKETYSLASHGVIGVSMHCFEDGDCYPFNTLRPSMFELLQSIFSRSNEQSPGKYARYGLVTYSQDEANKKTKSPAYDVWYDKCGRYFVSADGLVKTTAAAEVTSASTCDPGRIMALYDQYKCSA